MGERAGGLRPFRQEDANRAPGADQAAAFRLAKEADPALSPDNRDRADEPKSVPSGHHFVRVAKRSNRPTQTPCSFSYYLTLDLYKSCLVLWLAWSDVPDR